MKILKQGAAFAWAFAVLGVPCTSFAQQLPSEVKIVNAFASGGPTDLALRIIGQQLQESGGPTIVIEAKPGGAGAVALNSVKAAPPDGKTMVMCESASMASNVWLFNKLSYDPIKDFWPITPLYSVTVELVVPKGASSNSLLELLQYAKEKHGGINYASQSVGASGHLFGALMQKIAGVPMTHIPFRGAAPAMTELIAGRVDMMWTSYAGWKPYYEGGKVKALATSGKERNPLFPEVPTVREAGYPQFEFSFWFGLCAPAGTPDAIITWLNEKIVSAVRSSKVIDAYRHLGLVPDTSAPGEFAQRIKDDTEKMKVYVDATGAKLD